MKRTVRGKEGPWKNPTGCRLQFDVSTGISNLLSGGYAGGQNNTERAIEVKGLLQQKRKKDGNCEYIFREQVDNGEGKEAQRQHQDSHEWYTAYTYTYSPLHVHGSSKPVSPFARQTEDFILLPG